MKKIFITRKLLDINFSYIKEKFNVVHNQEDKKFLDSDIVRLSSDCDGILTFPNNNFHTGL